MHLVCTLLKEGKSSRELLEKVRVNAAFFLGYFGILGGLLGLHAQQVLRTPPLFAHHLLCFFSTGNKMQQSAATPWLRQKFCSRFAPAILLAPVAVLLELLERASLESAGRMEGRHH